MGNIFFLFLIKKLVLCNYKIYLLHNKKNLFSTIFIFIHCIMSITDFYIVYNFLCNRKLSIIYPIFFSLSSNFKYISMYNPLRLSTVSANQKISRNTVVSCDKFTILYIYSII